MTFRGKIDYRAGSIVSQQFRHQRAIANIAPDENMSFVACQGRQILQITRISQIVEIDNHFIRLGKPIQNKIRTDKTCAASY